jgi:hypothetical protein
VRPEIELSTIDIRGKMFEQLFAVVSFESEIVVDRIVDAVKLTADLFGLFEYKRVETKLIAPKSG